MESNCKIAHSVGGDKAVLDSKAVKGAVRRAEGQSCEGRESWERKLQINTISRSGGSG